MIWVRRPTRRRARVLSPRISQFLISPLGFAKHATECCIWSSLLIQGSRERSVTVACLVLSWSPSKWFGKVCVLCPLIFKLPSCFCVSSPKDLSVIFIINPSIRWLINYRAKSGTLLKSKGNKSPLNEMNRKDILNVTFLICIIWEHVLWISSLWEIRWLVTDRRRSLSVLSWSMRTEFLFTSESNYSLCLRSGIMIGIDRV